VKTLAKPTAVVVFFFVVGLLAAAVPLTAAKVNIKFASQAPENSPWHAMFKELGAGWEEVTDGRVSLTIYPGGVSGDESDIIRKMRIGQLHAAALTSSGLTDIDESFSVFGIPLFFDSWDELNYVLEDIGPGLQDSLEENGYVFMTWGHIGWVHFFTKEPVARLDDLRKLKIFTWAGDDRMVQWWHANGFRPVPLALPDAMQGLTTGLIDTMISPPLAALSLQWYKETPYMIDIGLVPMVGALVMTRRAWNKIDEADRPKLLAVAKEVGQKLMRRIPGMDKFAVDTMKRAGLEVLEIRESEHSAEWLNEAKLFADQMRGEMVPEEIFDRARSARDEFRSKAEATVGAGDSSP